MDRDATQPNGREPARPDDDPEARIRALRDEGAFVVVDIPNDRDWLERAEAAGRKAGLSGADFDVALVQIATEAARRDPELERRAADPSDPLHSSRDLIMQRPDLAKLAKAFATGYREGTGAGPSQRKLVWADNIKLLLESGGMIDGMLPRTGFCVLYGESGSGKTFVAIDLAGHVAAGLPWQGQAVEQGVVIYIASEAPESVKRRVWAWKRRHGVEHLPVLIVLASVDLLNGSTGELVELVTKVTMEHGRVAMVVVDTLARAMIGNENSPDDMGAFVTACGQLRDAGDCLVLIVHHSGKDTARGARGHSCLRAATDVEIEITNGDIGGCIRITKARDELDRRTFGFHLAPFELGTNNKGRMVSTCTVEPADAPARTPEGPTLTAKQKTVLDCLATAIVDHGEAAPGARDIPHGARVVRFDRWCEVALRYLPSDQPTFRRREAFGRNVESLQAKGLIRHVDGWCWLSPQ